METPSTRRITRSQARASLANSATSNTNISRKMEDSEKVVSKSTQRNAKQDRSSALIDITNDSPIVGLASGSLETPISSLAKQRSNFCKRTPGSGEALLRSQVKTLLQRVEEEAEISKLSLLSEGNPIPKNLKAFLNSPAALLAPTPTNTPQVLNFDVFESFGSVSQSPIQDELNISQVVSGIFDEKKHTECGSESEKDLISRTLFLDFSEKSDSSSDCSSVVTYQAENQEKVATIEDDDASIWSIQVNASTRDDNEDEDEDEDEEVEEDSINDDDCDEEDEAESVLLDELCEGISKINVDGEMKGFMGKHTRFTYNSDDELFEDTSSDVLRLKGLPTPKGKHLRFKDEEQ